MSIKLKPIIVSPRLLVIFLLIIVVLPAVALVYYKYNQSQSGLSQLEQNNSGSPSDNEDATLISKVRELVDFADDTTPTIATVSDTSKLTDQSFFLRAQNGDKVLVFSQAKRAVLYRPSTHKIIEVAPVNLNSSATPSGEVASAATTPAPKVSPSNSPTSTPNSNPLSILLINGTTTAGLTSKLEPAIKNFYPQAVFEKQSANKTDYSNSQIIALNEELTPYVDKLAIELNLEKITESPYGEDLSGEYDIAIIVGSDQIKN